MPVAFDESLDQELMERIGTPAKWLERLRQAFPGAHYAHMISLPILGHHRMVRVHLDLVVDSGEGEDKAYLYKGSWRQCRTSAFDINLEASAECCEKAFREALNNFKPTSLYKDPT
jgi:sirohydrochlorin ferrochelatase